MGVIYCAKNKHNNKVYVGKTVQELDVRWGHHVNLANRGKNLYFYNAIRKYGSESFELSVLETLDDEVALYEAEKKWIRDLNSSDHHFGYNSTYGGEGFSSGDKNPNRVNPRRGAKNHNFGKPLAEETKKKISETLTGLLAGEKNPFYGKNHTPETRKLIGDQQRGQKRGPHAPETCEKIRQRMLGREFSPETLDKMSKAKQGRELTPEHKEKLKAAQQARRAREAEAKAA